MSTTEMSNGNSAQQEALAHSFALGDRCRDDGCPGVFSLHQARDGAIGRIRFPGGRVSPAAWAKLADWADTYGDGDIHFTTRGNLQIRGIKDEETFQQAVAQSPYLPSASHERMRNIIASPIVYSGTHDLGEWITALDSALLAEPAVAGLAGRTLFGIDAGLGDIVAHKPDFGLYLGHSEVLVIVGGKLHPVAVAELGSPKARTESVAALITIAKRWQSLRGDAWRVAERSDLLPQLLDGIGTQSVLPGDLPAPGRPVGWLELPAGQPVNYSAPVAGAEPQADPDQAEVASPEPRTVVLAAGLRFGAMSSDLARIFAAIERPVWVTPWHSVVIHDLDEHEAEQIIKITAPRGLIFDANSDWLRVSACPGSRYCAKGLSDTRSDAMQAIASGVLPEGRVHFSGCVRRCGHPLGTYVDYLATADGEYEVETRTP